MDMSATDHAREPVPACAGLEAGDIEPRTADVVMSLRRAGAAVPTALSFARSAMRELVRGRWRIEKLRFSLDEQGRGEVLYRLHAGAWTFHFFLISNKLPEEQKSDRNFAASWDAMGVLCQGEWTAQRESYLRREVPKQRAGHADYDTLIYARGNRSGRLFEHVVDSLAGGRQPDLAQLAPVGYILRTTAFIGNGALGTRPFAGLGPDHPLRRPYHAQFCSAYLLREFVFDLVDHLAHARSSRAARLDPAYRRYLGLGNSAATGLVPFVVNHPHLMHRWSLACERAMAGAAAQPVAPSDDACRRFGALLDKAILHHAQGARPSDGVFASADVLVHDLRRVRSLLDEFVAHGCVAGTATRHPWQAITRWAATQLHPESTETVYALVLELAPDVVAAAADDFTVEESFALRPRMHVAQLQDILRRQYAWTREPALTSVPAQHFWYRSTQAPRDVRRAWRGRAPELEHESTVDTVLQVQRLWDAIDDAGTQERVGHLVASRPELRHIVTRVQSLAGMDYAELRAHWLAPGFSPFEPVRFALSFFGMEKFEAAPPKSVRGTFMQGAPIAQDVAQGRDGDWPYPLMPSSLEQATPPPADAPVVTLDAPDPTGGVHVATSDPPTLLIAPAELARQVQAVLQGHGATLGQAEEAAQLVAHAHATGQPALVRVLCRAAPGSFRSAWTPSQGAGGTATCVDAHGASALVAAPDALAWVAAEAERWSQPAVAHVRSAADVSLVCAVVLAAARDGCIGVLAWSEPDAGRHGYAVAGPGSHGPWLLEGHLDGPARLLVTPDSGTVAPDPGAHPAGPDELARWLEDLLGTHSAPHATGPDSFALACLPATDGGHMNDLGRLPILLAARPPAGSRGLRLLDGPALAAQQQRHQREGLPVQRAALDALARAGAAAFVPADQEHRVLEPGFDPLRSF